MVEKVDYQVLRTIGDIEIRLYPPIVLAVVSGLEDNTAFGYLFRYISGDNESRKGIEMTAPVISSQKIDMTAPVISDGNRFAFVLPSDFTIESAPNPTHPRVELEQVKRRRVAALRFRGRTTKRLVDKKTAELSNILKKESIGTVGDPFLMRYNPPYVPGFLRRNEIAVEISGKK